MQEMANIGYSVERKPFRRSLSIVISSDNRVVVKASKTLPRREIDKFLREKSVWIHKTLLYNINIKKPYVPKVFCNGELLWYLGNEYPLIIVRNRHPDFSFKNEAFFAHIPENCVNEKSYISGKLTHWYKEEAYKYISSRVLFYENVLDVKVSELRVRTLKSTWGNCSKKGVVTFSWKVIMAPTDIIDYLIVHELSHIAQHNHSRLFWNKVASVIPNYKESRKWLRIHENQLEL